MSPISCQRCRARDEHHYKHLDDENKRFLVPMMGDFKQQLIIPKEFVGRLKGEIPGEIELETRNGFSYPIKIAKYQEKHLLTLGWGQFVQKFHLKIGDSLLFTCNGNSLFRVIIFDKLGREEASSVVVDPFPPLVQERSNEAHESGSATMMDVLWERCESWDEYHYMNLDDEKKHFLMRLTGRFQDQMIMAKEFVQRMKGEIPRKIQLETKNGRSYIVTVASNQEQQLVLTAGWGPFVEKFSLQMSDTIIFRYKGNSHFEVIIFDRRGCEKTLSIVDLFPPHMLERRTDVVAETPSRRTEAAADLLLYLHEQMETVESMDRSPQLPTPSPTQFHVQYHQPMQTNEAGSCSHVDPQPMAMKPLGGETVNCLQAQLPPTLETRVDFQHPGA